MPSLLDFAVAFAAVTITTLAAADTSTTNRPALRFHFTLKRSSMNIFGQSDFSMTANPVVSDDGAGVVYNTYATFTADSTIYNYTFVDGAEFVAKNYLGKTSAPVVTCLGPESGKQPPINSIVTALNEATAVLGSNSRFTQCSTGNLYSVLINSINFSVCILGSSGMKLYGTDMKIAVKYLNRKVEFVQPAVDVDTLHGCKTPAGYSSVTTIGKSLLTGSSSSFDKTRKLKAEFDFTFWSDDDDDDASQHSSDHSSEADPENCFCSCKSTPRSCIFIHGVGIDKEEPENIDSFDYYWGNLTDHAPCSSYNRGRRHQCCDGSHTRTK